MKKDDDDMSEQDRRIADHIAAAVVARILDAVQNEEVAEKVMTVWGGKVDQTIGRGLRRLGFYVVVLAVGIAALRLNVLDRIWEFFKP